MPKADLASTTLCLLHRAHMPPATSDVDEYGNGYPTDSAYPSRNIAFQAAGMITSIIEHLRVSDELKFTPAFMYVHILHYIVSRLTITQRL